MADALEKPRNQRVQRGGPPISMLVTRGQSHFRQGLADEGFVKVPALYEPARIPWHAFPVLDACHACTNFTTLSFGLPARIPWHAFPILDACQMDT